MNGWKPVIAVAVMVAACLTSGCRSGISKHGKTASFFLVPMYKQPEGFSSTYRRHLMSASTVEQFTIPEISNSQTEPVNSPKHTKQQDTVRPAEKSEPAVKSEEVVIPTANWGFHPPSYHRNLINHRSDLFQPVSLDREVE